MIPALRTDPLILRPYQRGDFNAYAAFMAGGFANIAATPEETGGLAERHLRGAA